MRVYLDTSVLNRPFDDQTQPRIWLETTAAAVIMAAVREGVLELASSSVLEYERARDRSADRRSWVAGFLSQAAVNCVVTPGVEGRGAQLEALGLDAVDALHVAAAESMAVDYFITCDDRLLARAACAKVAVVDPLEFTRREGGGP